MYIRAADNLVKLSRYFSSAILVAGLSTLSISQIHGTDIEDLERLVRYTELRRGPGEPVSTISSQEGGDKCGLWISFTIAREWEKFSSAQQKRISAALSPPEMQKDKVIGHFRIFYDTSGYNEPALLDGNFNRIPESFDMYIDSVGKYLNYTWEYEIDSLRYDTGFMNGEAYYNIYIESLSGMYGETVFMEEDRINGFYPPRYKSYIRLDNDYRYFYSPGISGLKVTIAHEFHHAIQIGSYGFWGADIYFYEITSTWMEDVVFNEINDYYQYLKNVYSEPIGHFLMPDVSFRSNSGDVTYSRAIWGKFIEKKYSPAVIRRTWENVRLQHRMLQALDLALSDSGTGSSFRKAFLEWAVWNSNTGPECDTVKYYTEGREYPEMNFRSPVEYLNTPRSFADSIEALSSCYHPVCILKNSTENCNTSPQMLVIVSNLNANEEGSSKFGFTYDLSNTGGAGYTLLSNGIFVRLIVGDPGNWATHETASKITEEVVVQPNPFAPIGRKPLIFRIPQPVAQQTGTLHIFSSGMIKILGEEVNILSRTTEPEIQWDGNDGRGEAVSSGIYIYVISVDGKIYTGKFAVLRE